MIFFQPPPPLLRLREASRARAMLAETPSPRKDLAAAAARAITRFHYFSDPVPGMKGGPSAKPLLDFATFAVGAPLSGRLGCQVLSGFKDPRLARVRAPGAESLARARVLVSKPLLANVSSPSRNACSTLTNLNIALGRHVVTLPLSRELARR